ncbi:hypothetical protein E2562_016319 [Oryza meyeriana var. granulata]|uniref:Uncharacterized protein n=1 Tax=Oryza meyeriana var. granulata TaxID=110450 RepID=A0A6G1DWM0_9ORYZ|nr:hypothetical protein E2562_016319 [Oryza meyeriana var. granulata]
MKVYDHNKRVGSILNDLEVAETLVANLMLDEIDDTNYCKFFVEEYMVLIKLKSTIRGVTVEPTIVSRVGNEAGPGQVGQERPCPRPCRDPMGERGPAWSQYST